MMEKKADRRRREERGRVLKGGRRGRESVGRNEEVWGGEGEYKSFAVRN